MANVIIVYQITNRKRVFECSSHVFDARFFCMRVFECCRQTGDLNTNPEICGLVVSCLHNVEFSFCMIQPRESASQNFPNHTTYLSIWLNLTEFGDVKQHC